MQAASTHTSTKQLLLVVSSNGKSSWGMAQGLVFFVTATNNASICAGTNLSVVQGVLQAAGVPVVRAGESSRCWWVLHARKADGLLMRLACTPTSFLCMWHVTDKSSNCVGQPTPFVVLINH